MAVNKDAMEKMRAFLNNPSDETLAQIIPQGLYYCCLSYLVDDFVANNAPYCPKECPGGDTIYDHYCLCIFDQLKRLWAVDQAKAVLYVIRLLACAESYAGLSPSLQKRGGIAK
jgi:hypothetical protein